MKETSSNTIQWNYSTTPIVINDDNQTLVAFSFNILLIKGVELEDYYLEELEQFIQYAHERYYKRYSSQPVISRAVRTVDREKLASDVISQMERCGLDGCARFNIVFMIQHTKDPMYFVKEMVGYTLQWYETERETLLNLFPIGFQTLHDLREVDNMLLSSMIFDLRVSYREIESSLEFFKEKVMSGIDPYFKHLVEVYTNVSDMAPPIDFEEVKCKLLDTVDKIYSKRLLDPEECARDIVFLDAVYTGTCKEDSRLMIYIRLETETTLTPMLSVLDPEYKTKGDKKSTFVHSFNHTAPTPAVVEEV